MNGNKYCPLITTPTGIRYCSKACEWSVKSGDDDDDVKCGFKVLLFEMLDIRTALVDIQEALMDGGGE